MKLYGLMLLLLTPAAVNAHDAHGRSNAPIEARRLKSPLAAEATPGHLDAGRRTYQAECAGCHGQDGKARTRLAGMLAVRPTDLSEYMMESMRDGEIYWVVTHGIGGNPAPHMPAFDGNLSGTQRWEVVLWVRELRARKKAVEIATLGRYEWSLPAGFPFPNVPKDNPMTMEKVELGRYLFYDKRLSLNQTQSCATCHRQEKAFTDARARGLGSTGQLHPRGPMSLANVAYSPALTWANPNMRQLESQALVPMFGETPVELGLSGKEDVLLGRLRTATAYRKLFPAAFPDESEPFTIANVTKAIASFERILLSGDSPYDDYRRGDNVNAISASAKRGETLFFSERTECFHCHGGFTFTGSLDYLGKGITEVEFHNTGLYNLIREFSYPKNNLGLYEFTRRKDDVGKFKAPTLRNIAVTGPYMHDGSIATLEEVISHYKAGGRTIRSGPLAGNGSQNLAKSQFVKEFDLNDREMADMLAFLRSLTDNSFLSNPRFADPWRPPPAVTRKESPYVLHGEVATVYIEDGSASLYHSEVPGLMAAMRRPASMEFRVADKQQLRLLQPGMKIVASVRKQGADYILENIRPDFSGGRQ